MIFKDIELTDKLIIDKYLNISPKYNCDFCFTNIYLLKDYYNTQICIEDNTLYLRYNIENEYLYFIPLGDVNNGIKKLSMLYDDLKIINIEIQDLDYFSDDFEIKNMCNNDDYIYLCNDLAHLSGKKYKAKRNLVNSFKKNYEYNVFLIRDINCTDLDILNEESFIGEKKAILTALKHLDELNLDGLCITINNKIVGITIGTYSNDTFITHFEKVDYSYSGIAQAINYFMANYLLNRIKYINREEDLGIEGIRNAKISYNPIKMIKSYTAFKKH